MKAMSTRCLLLVLIVLVPVTGIVSAQDDVTHPAFDAAWSRTDRPVADGVADRTWMWGPEPITPVLPEPHRHHRP